MQTRRSWCRRVVAANQRQRPGNDLGLAMVCSEDHTRQRTLGFPERRKNMLEALGLLLALLAFGPGESLDNTALNVQVPAFTDNKENGYVINKLMTTRFPSCAVVMELAAQAEMRGARIEAAWTPRERNQEADDLSNLKTISFERAKLAGAPGALRSRKAVARTEGKGSRTVERGVTAGEEEEEEEEEGRQIEVQRHMVDLWCRRS